MLQECKLAFAKGRSPFGSLPRNEANALLKHMLKKFNHNPSHLFLDDTLYFVTAAIYEKRSLLASHEYKIMLHDTLETVFRDYHWQLHHWVILDNHYHLLGQSKRGKDLSRVMHDIHFTSAAVIQKEAHHKERVWWNYWDYCPRNERDYMTRQNYLLYNPVKHGYVTDLKEYAYSSFHEVFAQLKRNRLVEQFRKYPDYKTLRITEAHNDDF